MVPIEAHLHWDPLEIDPGQADAFARAIAFQHCQGLVPMILRPEVGDPNASNGLRLQDGLSSYRRLGL